MERTRLRKPSLSQRASKRSGVGPAAKSTPPDRKHSIPKHPQTRQDFFLLPSYPPTCLSPSPRESLHLTPIQLAALYPIVLWLSVAPETRFSFLN
jgi:hypothetical protein